MKINGQLLSKHSPDNNKSFNFVVPTYNGGTKLECFINCMLSQTCDDYHVTVVSDGPEPDTLKQMSKYFEYKNISYYALDKRTNDYGHTPREYGMMVSDCKYTVMTGFDNYYMPVFVEIFSNAVKSSEVGLIYCDFVLDHVRENLKYNGYINAKPQVNYIDIGCFATLTRLAKQIGFKFRGFAADWDFFKAVSSIVTDSKLNTVKISQTLYVHN